jgi:dihydrofolate reductase
MGKVIVEAEVSLDGVIGSQSPEFWTEVFRYHDAGVADYLKNLLFSGDALLMGRKTYELFAQVWPTRSGEEADRINRMPKFVASRSVRSPLVWNATLLEGDIGQAIRTLKAEPDRVFLQYGIGELTQTMLQHGLVDELRLVAFPFVAGRGPRMFEDFDGLSLKLLETKPFGSGAVALHYQPSQG